MFQVFRLAQFQVMLQLDDYKKYVDATKVSFMESASGMRLKG